MKKNIPTGKAIKKRKPSILKTRYKDNPFATEDGFRVPIKNKTEVIQTDGPASVVVNDEKIAIAQIRRITTVDSDPFVKVFTAELDRFFDLTPTAMRIVTVLLQSIGKFRMGDGDLAFLNESSISEVFVEHNMKPPSSTAYYRALEELVTKGFVAPSEQPPLYFINPAIFFNGDRVRFVTEIRRKKRNKLEELEAQGQTALRLDQDPETD